ncbi:Vitamin B12-binding protein [Austwickia sp. TVS 96-490-7B]|uniref:ABC transporter substrate-binding protein n=1 Tax=Austwickia sp. TVS 96-490-7B TaxID=2830843 RepID=UPI001C580707|nr:ABC transporter substrate-binding protein [Austwickia sp. TVS 96-490-7B]MBW3085474.1 Vitamin B12-binding protein [Austwickia sp. TVS 96-490-7B]
MRHIRRTILTTALSLAVITGATACAGAPEDTTAHSNDTAHPTPVALTNCGREISVSKPPSRLVTLNQGATQVALALGLQDRMVGTAYLDDAVPSRWAQAYQKVPVMAPKYPAKETFLAAKPDMAYATFASAFTDKGVGDRDALAKDSVTTYTSPMSCPKGTSSAPASFDSAWAEVRDMARIFGVQSRADEVIEAQRTAITKIHQAKAGAGRTVLWYDSGTDTPFVGAGKGGPQSILDAVGAKNVFADLDGGWAKASWEKVVAAEPDVIVLIDASWDTAASKKAHLEADPVLNKLDAVKNKAYVTIPFSESNAGITLADGAQHVSDQLAALKTSHE